MSWKLGGASFLCLLMAGCGACASEPEPAEAPAQPAAVAEAEAEPAAPAEAAEAAAADAAAPEEAEGVEGEAAEAPGVVAEQAAAPSEDAAEPVEPPEAAASADARLEAGGAEGLAARATQSGGADTRRMGGLDRRAETPKPRPAPAPEPEPVEEAAPAELAEAPAEAPAEPPAPEVRRARARVDRSGGIVRLDGASVTFPPEAVRLARSVTLSHAQDQWRLEAEGLEAFYRPVEIALPIEDGAEAQPVWAPVAGTPSARKAETADGVVRFPVFRPGRGVVKPSRADTVTVVTRNAHVLERGRMQVTVVDPVPFEAFVREGEGLRPLPVEQAPGSGIVEVTDVPADRAVLLGRRSDRSGLWVETTAGAVDWSRMVEAEARGRLDPASPGTRLDLVLRSAEPWSPSHGMAFAARNGLYATRDAPGEAEGAIDWTIDWDEQPLALAPLSASKGDVAEVAQTRRRELDDGSSYTVPVRWARLATLEMGDGVSTREEVELQPVSGSQVADVKVDAGALYGLAGRLGPGAPRFTSGPSVTVKTLLADRTGATLLTAQGFDPKGLVDLSGYAMPRPYEAARDLVVSAFLMDVYEAAPYGHGTGYAVVEAPFSQIKGGTLAPTLSAPGGLAVNGRDAMSGKVTRVGDAPRVTWSAPETGDPDYYRVSLKLAGASPRIFTFFTRDTGLRLPALGLQPGDTGVIEVTAVDEKGGRPAPAPRPAAPERPTTTVTVVSSAIGF